MCKGSVNTPDRQTAVRRLIEFSWVAIQELTVAALPPCPAMKVTEQKDGGEMGEPVGVAGFGMRPLLRTGASPFGSKRKALALTGGTGWATVLCDGAAFVAAAPAGETRASGTRATAAATIPAWPRALIRAISYRCSSPPATVSHIMTQMCALTDQAPTCPGWTT